MSNSPLVTGISPKEGPPGTKVTIRGERLGKSHNDLIRMEICGVNCFLTAEWVSPNKILARTLLCKGKGDILICTKSGGQGSSTVQFRGFTETIGPTKETAVWVDETVNVTRLSMASFQQEDPLQISFEGNEKKFPVEELLDLFPEGSGSLRSENFVPAWLLLENHHLTPYEDLKSGHHFLSRKVGSQTEGKLSFLKENINSVIDQLDALISLKEKCDKYHKKFGNSFINHIDETITECEKEGLKLFQDVLARKDKADMTRNALSAFNRFRFLFSLPGTIEKSIEKGEFDTAINDYLRAKTLFDQPETDKPIFRKFRQEVESRINKLRETLKFKLLEKPPNADDQRVYIGHLVTLECDYDPAWLSITSHYEYIIITMQNCFHQFSNSDKPKDILRTPSKQEQANYPTPVLFVEALSDIFINYFPAFWQLGQDYFGSKLLIKPDLGMQADMKKMMVSCVQLFSQLITTCLLQGQSKTKTSSEFVWNDKTSDSMSEWLPHCLNDIRDSFTELLALDPPREMIDIIRNLLFRIRTHSLEIMLHQLSTEVGELYKQEIWGSEPSQGNHGFITSLPSRFEMHVINSAKVIKKTLLQKYIEERQLLKSEEVKEILKDNMGIALASFADTLELLISTNRVPSRLNPKQREGNFPSSTSRDPEEAKSGLPKTHSACLLLVLNNCAYTKEIILGQIHKALIKLGYPDMPEAIEKATAAITGVQKLTFTKYTEMKYEPVVGQIEMAMFAGQFDWEKCREPSGVRSYITKALIGLIEIIAEVTSVSEKLISPVMTQVVENVCEELMRLFTCVSKFNEFGSMQSTLDVLYFQTVVSAFMTQNSKSLLKETFNSIPRSSEFIKSREIQRLLDSQRISSKMQFLCFTTSTSTNTSSSHSLSEC